MADLLPRPLGNPLGGFIGNELLYMGNVLRQGRIPYIAPNNTLGPRIGRIPPSANGESYRRAELRLADAARPGGGGGGGGNAGYSVPNFGPVGGTPAERAYQSAASQAAQMTAQNPDFQRYETARAAAAKSGDQAKMDAARDIGMQMWAKANPTLAANVKPGQSGYEAIQGVLNAGQMGAPLDLPFNPSNLLSTTPAPQTVEYGQSLPTSLPPGAAVPTNAFGSVKPGMFQRFRDQTALEVSPLGTAEPLTNFSYGGAVQPIGSAIVDEAFKTDKARQMAEMYKNALLSRVK